MKTDLYRPDTPFKQIKKAGWLSEYFWQTLGLVFLIVSLSAAFFLTRQSQDIRQQASVDPYDTCVQQCLVNTSNDTAGCEAICAGGPNNNCGSTPNGECKGNDRCINGSLVEDYDCTFPNGINFCSATCLGSSACDSGGGTIIAGTCSDGQVCCSGAGGSRNVTCYNPGDNCSAETHTNTCPSNTYDSSEACRQTTVSSKPNIGCFEQCTNPTGCDCQSECNQDSTINGGSCGGTASVRPQCEESEEGKCVGGTLCSGGNLVASTQCEDELKIAQSLPVAEPTNGTDGCLSTCLESGERSLVECDGVCGGSYSGFQCGDGRACTASGTCGNPGASCGGGGGVCCYVEDIVADTSECSIGAERCVVYQQEKCESVNSRATWVSTGYICGDTFAEKGAALLAYSVVNERNANYYGSLVDPNNSTPPQFSEWQSSLDPYIYACSHTQGLNCAGAIGATGLAYGAAAATTFVAIPYVAAEAGGVILGEAGLATSFISEYTLITGLTGYGTYTLSRLSNLTNTPIFGTNYSVGGTLSTLSSKQIPTTNVTVGNVAGAVGNVGSVALTGYAEYEAISSGLPPGFVSGSSAFWDDLAVISGGGTTTRVVVTLADQATDVTSLVPVDDQN